MAAATLNELARAARTSSVAARRRNNSVAGRTKPLATADAPMSDLCSLIWCALIGLFRSRAALKAPDPCPSTATQRAAAPFLYNKA
jgi:hypothetical protein